MTPAFHTIPCIVHCIIEHYTSAPTAHWLIPWVRFKRQTDAAAFVRELYQAGAAQVIVPDIYQGKAGDEFADGLLVRLTKKQEMRKSVRAVCAKLRRRRLGAVEPSEDIGESHLYLSMA